MDGDHIIVSVPEAVLVSDVETDEGFAFEHELVSEVVEGPDICCGDGVVEADEADEADGISIGESVLGGEVAIEEVLDSDHHVLTTDLMEDSAGVPDQVFEMVSEEVLVSNCDSEAFAHEEQEDVADSVVTTQSEDDEEDERSASEDYLMISCNSNVHHYSFFPYNLCQESFRLEKFGQTIR